MKHQVTKSIGLVVVLSGIAAGVTAAVTAIAIVSTVAVAASEPPAEMVSIAGNTFICKFKEQVLAENVPAFVQEIATQTSASVRHEFYTVIKGFSAVMNAAAAENLQSSNPNIAIVYRTLW
jgi:hypothetical protein